MLNYQKRLKLNSRRLRSNMTDSERLLWFKLRRRQIGGIQFYRQKPIGNYVVDFYAPKAKLVIEVDGSHHMTKEDRAKDENRDNYLLKQGLKVLRFDNSRVLKDTEAVLETIFNAMGKI